MIITKQIRCAIYTRKSTEEGLEQSFNSLHAQREACEAYVTSQKHEGWQVVSALYDDGGFSGGNMERPGLKKLLADIASAKVDTVVVYKVDRLTLSLSDFARIVESFDSKGVSFVSVTQQFNTTSSMGRLTLNVLLSFAQFEREVTGERIRDKVAASKRKGIWMGGIVPLGYQAIDGELIVDEAEAETVCMIFREYLRLGSVFDLQHELANRGVRSKHRIAKKTGREYGKAILSRGTLYHLLSNPVYIGKTKHGDKVFDGLHAAIIDQKMWDMTAEMLKNNQVKRRTSRNLSSGRPLLGLLFHENGYRFAPSHASKKGRRYIYYVSPGSAPTERLRRLPANGTEQAVATTIRSFLSDPLRVAEHCPGSTVRVTRLLITSAKHRAEQLADLSSIEAKGFLRMAITRIVVSDSNLSIHIDPEKMRGNLLGELMGQTDTNFAPLILICPFEIKRRGSEVRLVLGNDLAEADPVASLSRAVARAHDWATQIVAGEAKTMADLVRYSGLTKPYIRRILRTCMLAPSLTEAILNGTHSPDLTVLRLTNKLPFDWHEQGLR